MSRDWDVSAGGKAPAASRALVIQGLGVRYGIEAAGANEKLSLGKMRPCDALAGGGRAESEKWAGARRVLRRKSDGVGG